ncbi:MAG: cupredoxin domain-containing protein [Acetobacteraceae bacterium]
MRLAVFPALLLTSVLAAPVHAASPAFSLSVGDHRFDPAELVVPAGQKIELHIRNTGTVPAEFESSDLGREKVVPAGSEITLSVGPLKPGRYTFFDDFHPSTRGHLVAR